MELVTGAMGSLLPKLGKLLKEEYNLQTGVRAQVGSLSGELEIMHAALRKMAEVPHEQLDELAKLWARDLREMSYDMEDVVDTFLVRVDDDRDATSSSNMFEWLIKNMVDFFSKAKACHQIDEAIKDIKNQLQELASRRGKYTVNDIVAMPAATSTIDPRLLAMYKDATQLVGIDGPRDALIEMLSDKKMKIVSIVGFGGLGKTTLAKAVYDKLKAGFDYCAFVPVGQNPNVKKVLRDILIDCNYTNSNMMILDERQLINELRQFLQKKRYLVVIDDIWAMSVWAMIRCALPDENLENRIIATTRHLDVAKEIGGAYNLQPLSDANSEKLFYGRIFGGECPDNQLREVSDRILRKCGGVPLAIVTIASLLSSKTKKTTEWNKVHDSIGAGLLNGPGIEDMRLILSLSYYSLPPHLRTCLLYLSIFPEDYEIGKDQLIWLWIAEGFIQYGEQGKTLYELGECYFKELINRSLIQPIYIAPGGKVENCRVHDMVLDLIRSLSNEENFVTVLDGAEQNISWQRNVRRLSIQNTSDVTASLDALRKPQALRSLIFFSSRAINLNMPPSRFCSLRVLELKGCYVGEARHLNLGNLLHLRYLGLRETGIEQLPVNIGKLQFLQTLDLRANYKLQELPSTLVQLRQLMCLRVDGCSRLPDGMGSLASLEVFSTIRMESLDYVNFVKEMRKLTGLRDLELCLASYGGAIAYGPSAYGRSVDVDLAESLCNLPKIHSLIIDFHDRCLDHFGKLWAPPECLARLVFGGAGFFSRIPACIERDPAHLSDLSSLYIQVKPLRQEDIQILARLPALCSLRIRGDADGRLIIDAGGFHCLRHFMCRRKTPMFQQGAMPMVESVFFTLDVRKRKDDVNDGFETGLGNLLSLDRVEVRMGCREARAREVKEAEAALRHAANVNRNSPTLQIERWGDSHIHDSGTPEESGSAARDLPRVPPPRLSRAPRDGEIGSGGRP